MRDDERHVFASGEELKSASVILERSFRGWGRLPRAGRRTESSEDFVIGPRCVRRARSE